MKGLNVETNGWMTVIHSKKIDSQQHVKDS